MNDCLIGFTGFVGSTLLNQRPFANLYRSNNINEIKGKSFDRVYCAGASAKKWLANKEPEEDLKSINLLLNCLSEVQAKQFILFSTIDVFKAPYNVDELSLIDDQGLHHYGKNRYLIEKFVEKNFKTHLIIRLPGLVGKGLKKNAIFDLKHNNNLNQIDSRGVFQFYPMQNLDTDVEKALSQNLKKIHLTSQPISIEKIAMECFGLDFKNHILETPPNYNMKTIHSLHGGMDYNYNEDFILKSIRDYASS